jgi:hypothetical protein
MGTLYSSSPCKEMSSGKIPDQMDYEKWFADPVLLRGQDILP